MIALYFALAVVVVFCHIWFYYFARIERKEILDEIKKLADKKN